MPSASSEIVITRPPEEVFAFLADPENDCNGAVEYSTSSVSRAAGSARGTHRASRAQAAGGSPPTSRSQSCAATSSSPSRRHRPRPTPWPLRPHRGRRGTSVRFELRADVKGSNAS